MGPCRGSIVQGPQVRSAEEIVVPTEIIARAHRRPDAGRIHVRSRAPGKVGHYIVGPSRPGGGRPEEPLMAGVIHQGRISGKPVLREEAQGVWYQVLPGPLIEIRSEEHTS